LAGREDWRFGLDEKQAIRQAARFPVDVAQIEGDRCRHVAPVVKGESPYRFGFEDATELYRQGSGDRGGLDVSASRLPARGPPELVVETLAELAVELHQPAVVCHAQTGQLLPVASAFVAHERNANGLDLTFGPPPDGQRWEAVVAVVVVADGFQ